MKQIMLLLCFLLSGIPVFAYGEQPDSEAVVILYNDSTGTIDLNDVETQPRPNRIIYHMVNVVLPKKYGINIKFKPILWSRGLELIKTGLADGIIDASYNDERATYSVYPTKTGIPDPAKMLRSIVYSLYKNKNSTISWDGTRLDGIDGDIASVSSFAIVSDLRKDGIIIQEEPNVTGIVRNLAIGKFKSAALQSYMADEFLVNNPALKENIIKIEPPLKRKEYYLIFSKKFYDEQSELAKAIWDAIEDYRSTDEYRQMRKEFEK